RMILEVFLLGMLSTIPVFFLQLGLSFMLKAFYFLYLPPLVAEIIKWFVVIAFTEELFKYLVVRLTLFKSKELDEPLDIMLYMVVAALGFAALENILYLFSPIENIVSFSAIVKTTITISFIRFIGATFLHTLCSALVGYFLALSSVRGHKGVKFTLMGIALATLLHGLYNFSIMSLIYPFNVAIPIAIILALAAFMIYDFNGIKKIKSICKI
ncbi:MAG: PrsW family intramembrane metalloprotease, partial [bacterium]|nr:PrsW family intramembrane metalloprotease [bacterium]